MKNRIKLFAAVVTAFLVSSFFVSCGETEEASYETIEGGVKRGGIYRINELEDIRSLDPVRIGDVVSHHVAHQLYDGLVDLDSNLQLVPQLATSWEISEDGLLYTFHLRKGVKFHDNKCFPDGKGREFTAQDVKYSYDRICDPRTQSTGYNYFKNYVEGAAEYYESLTGGKDGGPASEKGVSGFIVKDDSTFQIKITKPFGPFIYYSTLAYGYIVSREAVEMYGQDYFQNPVGTGPFAFVDWKPDLELNMARNPNYWEKDQHGNQLPYLDGAKFRFIKDLAAQQLEFTNGVLDESYRIPNETFRDVVGEDGNLTPGYSQFVLQKAPTLSIQYYGFLTSGTVFNNKILRQALNYAVDKEKVVKFVVNGQAFGPAVHGIVPPSMPDYPTDQIKGYEYNPEKAKQLLTEAGFPGGQGLPPIKLQINSGGDRNLQVAEAIQAMLKNVGINMELELIPFAQHLDNIDAGRANMWRLGWVADYPDPENFLNLYYGKNVPNDPTQISPINSTRYVNPEFDRLFEQAIATTDKTERYKLYAQAEQIAVDDAPMMYIYYDQDFRLVQPYVRGYVLDPMHRVNFRYLWLDK